jgi:hypothetical protein
MLIYEYMPNKSLDSIIFGLSLHWSIDSMFFFIIYHSSINASITSAGAGLTW